MRLSDYLRRDLVTLDFPPGGVEATLRTLTDMLEAAGVIQDAEPLMEALQEREAAHTTAMEGGVAIPHATVAALDEPVLCIAVAPEGTDFGPEEMESVRLFFFLLSPPESARLHIKILARIVRLLRHPGTLERLKHVTTAEALLDEIEQVEAQQR